MGKTNRSFYRIFRIPLAVLATLVLTLLVLNLSLGDKQIESPIPHTYGVRDPRFVHTMGLILGPGFIQGNAVRTLINGEEIFPAMLAAIRSARHSVTLETYIFFSGTIAEQLTEALVERAEAGVAVKVLLDWIGGELDHRLLARLQSKGVELAWYHAPDWTDLAKLNNRTHRKLLVVDGAVGFTGGVDIADKWRGDARSPGHWRDTHFEVTGPVVGQLQAAFADNWLQATGKILRGTEYFPQLQPTGSLQAQVFTGSPGGGARSMQLMYLLSIAAAEHTLRLSAAYFVPDEVALPELAQAARRGVRVQIIVPGEHIDWNVVRRASRHRWGPLLEAGVELYEYQPTMYHVKMLLADSSWVSVGSTNFDQRSFAINDEANLNVHDAAFAEAQARHFEDDLRQSRRITLEAWQSRPWSDKALDFAASLIGSQL
ncbi:cardiolipin synthase B [Oxalobacteraceae bacterium OM1]|nr:cardiolipin synthase B [Oxalobacteraceae bacterium OM1]